MTGLFLIFIAMAPFCLGRAVLLVHEGLYVQAGIMLFFAVVLFAWAYETAPGRKED